MKQWSLLLAMIVLLIGGITVGMGNPTVCATSVGLFPCTGDIGNAALFIGIAVVAAVVIILSIVLAKKGKK